MKKSLSISTLMNLVLALTTITVIALFGIYNYQTIKKTELKSLNASSETITKGIAGNIAFPLYNLDYPVVRDIIKNAMANQSVYAIVLLGENKENLVYGITRGRDWQVVELNKIEDFKEKQGIVRKVEVKHESETLGYLNVYVTKRFLNEKLNRQLIQTLIEIILLTAILTVINILLLRKLLIQPIKTLQSFAEEIKKGNLDSEIGDASFIGELSSLRTSLKEMADELLYSAKESGRNRVVMDPSTAR